MLSWGRLRAGGAGGLNGHSARLELRILYASMLTDSSVKVPCDRMLTDGDAHERTMAVSASDLFDGRLGRCGAQRSQQSGAPTPDRHPGQASRDFGEPVRRLRKLRRRS